MKFLLQVLKPNSSLDSAATWAIEPRGEAPSVVCAAELESRPRNATAAPGVGRLTSNSGARPESRLDVARARGPQTRLSLEPNAGAVSWPLHHAAQVDLVLIFVVKISDNSCPLRKYARKFPLVKSTKRQQQLGLVSTHETRLVVLYKHHRKYLCNFSQKMDFLRLNLVFGLRILKTLH